MKRTASNISCMTLILGGLGAMLRLWLFRAAEPSGLLPTSHISIILTWILTLIFVLFLFLQVRKMPDSASYSIIAPSGKFSGAGAILAGLGVAAMAVGDALFHWTRLMVVILPAGVAAGAAMIHAGYFRLRGKKPGLFHLELITLYLTLHTICQSQRWGIEPQTLRYFFPLTASLLMMLGSYWHACFLVKKKALRSYMVFAQASLYFGCLSFNDPSGFFYLSMILWILTGCLGDQEFEEAL